MTDTPARPLFEDNEDSVSHEEMLVTDHRAAMRPSEHVDHKLAILLKSSVPVSQLQKARPTRRP